MKDSYILKINVLLDYCKIAFYGFFRLVWDTAKFLYFLHPKFFLFEDIGCISGNAVGDRWIRDALLSSSVLVSARDWKRGLLESFSDLVQFQLRRSGRLLALKFPCWFQNSCWWIFADLPLVAHQAMCVLGPHILNFLFGEVVVFVRWLAAEHKTMVTWLNCADRNFAEAQIRQSAALDVFAFFFGIFILFQFSTHNLLRLIVFVV